MLVESKFFSHQTIPWKRPLIWIAYSGIIAFLFVTLKVEIGIPMGVPSILGTAISLFLAFRTNSAYQRWWEARQIWGSIVNNSRTFGRQILTFGNVEKEIYARHQAVKRQIVWNWVFAKSLRGEKIHATEWLPYVSKEEGEAILSYRHPANQMLFKQEISLANLTKEMAIDSFDFRKLDTTLSSLTDAMGKCERIKNTVFPTQYALYTQVFINLFLILLPLGLVPSVGFFVIPIHFSIGFTFGMIQNIAEHMQDPFDGRDTDVPIYSICRGIERNLLEMINGDNIPDPISPEEGVIL